MSTETDKKILEDFFYRLSEEQWRLEVKGLLKGLCESEKKDLHVINDILLTAANHPNRINK